MRLFLGVAAALAFLFSAGLLLSPEAFYAPMGLALTPLQATLAQAHGATLAGMGVLLWLGRDAEPKGMRAILWGNLVVQLLSLLVLLKTSQLGAGAKIAPGVVIHVTLGSFYAYFLSRTVR
jgi:hypothetical protein